MVQSHMKCASQSSLRTQVAMLSCEVHWRLHDMAVNPFGHHWTRTGGGGGGGVLTYVSCIGVCCHGKDTSFCPDPCPP